jgi:hypothetical protein
MADPGRVASGANLLAWLEREGCEHCVRLGETPGAGGVGVFATRDVERGEILISCPTRTVISAAETRLDVDPGMKAFAKALDDVRVARGDGSGREGTPLDDSTRMQLLLLRERHTEERQVSLPTDSQPRDPPPRDGSRELADVRFSGYWAAYTRALPGDELVASLPSSWSEPELERRLGGTSLFPEVLAERAELFSLAAALSVWRGDETSGDFAFARGAFGVSRLRWARAVFRSRAIALPLAGWGRGGAGLETKRSGGDDGALVPLLDMCNHARDAGTSLQRRGAAWRLVATRRFTRGEEVRIDYGGKGNGELLTRHGFVIPNNPFDTCSYRIGNASFTLHRGVREWREFPPGARDAAARFLRQTRGASFLGESSESASRDDLGGKRRRDGDTETRETTRSDESERDVIVLTFLAESARRLSAAAATTVAAPPGESSQAESVAPDASGFATSSAFLTDRACAMVRESQRELLSDLEDLARETIEATRTTTRLDDATTTKTR